MIDRKEFAEEILLRENIRKAIKIVQNKTAEAALKRRMRAANNSIFDYGGPECCSRQCQT